MRISTAIFLAFAWLPATGLPSAAQVINGETALDDTVLERETPESPEAARARSAAGARVDLHRDAPAPGEPPDGRRR